MQNEKAQHFSSDLEACWNALVEHQQQISQSHIKDFFASDANRAKNFTIEDNGVIFDFSKHKINQDTVAKLLDFAEKSDLKNKIQDLFNGSILNWTEGRHVLHTALRDTRSKELLVQQNNIMESVHAVGLLSG